MEQRHKSNLSKKVIKLQLFEKLNWFQIGKVTNLQLNNKNRIGV